MTMGCYRYLSNALLETLDDIRDFAIQMGLFLTRCFSRYFACSDCLLSAERVGGCMYGVLVFLAFTAGFPFVCCWIVCRAIGLCDEASDFLNRKTKSKLDNYLFYTNQLKSEPRGDYIDNILTKWRGNYQLLENHHGYIQWLFPLHENGMNVHAQILNDDERQMILEDETACGRIFEAYKLMLDFYGIILVDENTGEVARSNNYRKRFDNLNRRGHNCLRISRIIKCLEIFNFSHLTMHLVKFFITEIVREGNLQSCRNSCMRFWIASLGEEDAAVMRRYAKTLEMENMEQTKVEEIKLECHC